MKGAPVNFVIPESERLDLETRQAKRHLEVVRAGVERRRELLSEIETALIEGVPYDEVLRLYFPDNIVACAGCGHSCVSTKNPYSNIQ